MRNNKSHKNNKDEEVLEKKSTFIAWRDFFRCLDTYTYATLGASVLVAILFYVRLIYIDANEVSAICFNYCPKLIAFGIAAFVFILNIATRVRKNLTLTVKDDVTVAKFFCATLIWFTLVVFFVLISAILSKLIHSSYIDSIMIGLVIYTLLLFIDILMKLFSFHTFFYPIKEQ